MTCGATGFCCAIDSVGTGIITSVAGSAGVSIFCVEPASNPDGAVNRRSGGRFVSSAGSWASRLRRQQDLGSGLVLRVAHGFGLLGVVRLVGGFIRFGFVRLVRP